MSTAFLHCRVYQQRLRAGGFNATPAPGSRPSTPWALRPERLQWFMETVRKLACSPNTFVFAVKPNLRFVFGKRGQERAKTAAFFGLACIVSAFTLFAVTPAQAGVPLSFRVKEQRDASLRWHDGWGEGGMITPNHARAFALFLPKRLIWPKALAGTFPSTFFNAERPFMKGR